MNESNMAKVECPQGHRYSIDTDIIEPHGDRDGYKCPDCKHVVDAMNAMRRYGWAEQ